MTGETADADAERAEYLVFMSGWMGVDLAHYGLDEPIGNVNSNAILSALKVFQSVDPMGASGRSETSPRGARSAAWDRAIVRSVVRVADTLQEWVEEIDVKGFTQPRAITPFGASSSASARLIRPRGAEFEHCLRHVSSGCRDGGAMRGSLRTAASRATNALRSEPGGPR